VIRKLALQKESRIEQGHLIPGHGKTGRPHASKRPEPAFLKNTSRNSAAACPICEFQTSRLSDGYELGTWSGFDGCWNRRTQRRQGGVAGVAVFHVGFSIRLDWGSASSGVSFNPVLWNVKTTNAGPLFFAVK
jgi:hypothetical protein